MSLSVSQQGWALLLSLAMGFGLGLAYDILRPGRRAGGSLLGRLLDGAFALTAGVGLFLFAMAAGDGRLGTWELAAALLGFLLYMHLLSPLLLPLLEQIYRIAWKILERVKKRIKKVQNLLKKLFPKIRECFRIKE
ncbi:MAG: spore cortex biosynthesis protein YabQ [Candidatus Limivicinus sp.]